MLSEIWTITWHSFGKRLIPSPLNMVLTLLPMTPVTLLPAVPITPLTMTPLPPTMGGKDEVPDFARLLM